VRRLQFPALFLKAAEGGLEVGWGQSAAEDQGGFAEPLLVKGRSHHLGPWGAVGIDEKPMIEDVNSGVPSAGVSPFTSGLAVRSNTS